MDITNKSPSSHLSKIKLHHSKLDKYNYANSINKDHLSTFTATTCKLSSAKDIDSAYSEREYSRWLVLTTFWDMA